MNKEEVIEVPVSSFERLMTACCNQNKCLDCPSECQCAIECDLNLKELIE